MINLVHTRPRNPCLTLVNFATYTNTGQMMINLHGRQMLSSKCEIFGNSAAGWGTHAQTPTQSPSRPADRMYYIRDPQPRYISGETKTSYYVEAFLLPSLLILTVEGFLVLAVVTRWPAEIGATFLRVQDSAKLKSSLRRLWPHVLTASRKQYPQRLLQLVKIPTCKRLLFQEIF